jgi:hypothetical protein
MKSRAQLGTVGDLAAQHEMANDCTSSGDYLSGVGGREQIRSPTGTREILWSARRMRLPVEIAQRVQSTGL